VAARDTLPVTTRSICPHCGAGLDAELIDRDGRVILRRECPEHGAIEALAYGDSDRWRDAQRYDRPGAEPLLRQTASEQGCPSDCGLCPEHAQHTCLGIIEVNSGCNLDCPVCFAESGTGHQPDGFSLSLAQVESMLDAFVAAEGEPEAVQLSGGEPSIHPQILDILAAATARGIPLVMLNTNGIRLARDPRFAPALAALGVHVYLQFDGFEDATHLAIRGRRLQEIKRTALDRCAVAGVRVSLAAAVERGINEHELGAIVRFGVEHPAVNGVFFQPVTHTGRHPAFDPLDRLTNVEVIRGLCAQLPEWFREDDFVAVPCCSPTCRSATYALYDGEDLVPLPRLVDVDRYLGFVTNRAVPDVEVAAALSGLFSASAAGGTERTGDRLECVACGVGLPDELQRVAARGFMVVAQDFQDEWTLDVGKLRKCCVGEIVPDGRIIPFCAYNAAGYRTQVRADLAAGMSA
jgi:7,8-dihydro-6-hydroxymethylpterin dimethyltransferase